MIKIVLSSRNKKKIEEFSSILKKELKFDFELLTLDDIGYYNEIEENGSSFDENAIIKASVPARMGYIGIADDSGICVDALNGRPGIYSARYSGGDDKENNKLLLNQMALKSNRNAHYTCAIACVFPDHINDFTSFGYCFGQITYKEHGKNGFGYDPIFYYEPFGKTFGEISSDMKDKVSHRGIAIRQFAKKLKGILNDYDKQTKILS